MNDLTPNGVREQMKVDLSDMCPCGLKRWDCRLCAHKDPWSDGGMPNPIQAIFSPAGYRIVRSGARYAVHRDGDERPGAWVPQGEPLDPGWTDVYPENEARALLPFLRVRATAGRQAGEPTTPDGKLIARACKRLGLTAAALGEQIGAAEAVLSRARNGELPAKHRDAIKALLAPPKSKRKATT